MKRVFLLLLCVVFVASIPIVAMASDISNAIYSGNIQIANTGTSATGVSTNMTLNTQNSIDAGYISSSCNNTAIRTEAGADAAYMPSVNSTYPWCIWVPSIDADEIKTYKLYLGETTDDLDGKICYFTGPGGMATSDHVSLEYGNNFTDERSCYVDTTAIGSTIFNKGELLKCYITGTGNISVAFATLGTTANETGSGYPWTSDNNSRDGDTSTYATSYIAPSNWSAFLEFSGDPEYTDHIKYWATRSNTNINIIDVDFHYGAAWNDVYQGVPTVGSWTTVTHTSNQTITGFRMRFYNSGGSYYYAYLHEVSQLPCLTATGISSGEHKIEVYADIANLTLEIDDVVEDTVALDGASLTDTSDDWADGSTSAVPYIEYVKRYVDGSLVQHIEWEYATTFTDLSGNGNDATPAFPATGSDADVTAELLTLDAIELAELTSWTLAETSEMIQADDLPSTPAQAYTELQTTNLFLAPVFTALIADTDYEPATFWYPITILIIGLICIGINMASKSILLQGIVEIVLIGIASFTVIPWWCMIVYIFYAFAIMLAANRLPGGI